MFRFAGRCAAVALLFLACGTERSGEELPVRALQQQNQGTTDGTAHPFSVGVCLKASGPGQCQAICSGTLIAPNLVLTARHCVDNDTNAGESLRCGTDTFTTRSATTSNTFVTTAASMNQTTSGWHNVAEIITPATNDACDTDIALLRLTSNVGAAEAKPADVLAFGPMTDHARYSTEITFVSFGRDGEPVNTAGTRRILENVSLECIVGDPVFSDNAYCKAGGSITPTDGAPAFDDLDDDANFVAYWGGCPGDSGGGAYEQRAFDANKPLVMGVLSRAGIDQGVCVHAIFTRTDRWKDFLVANVTSAASAGGYAVPAWAQGPTVSPLDAGITRPTLDAGKTDAGRKDGGGTTDIDGGPAPGETGAACERATDCDSNACVAIEGQTAKCVEHCADDDTCPGVQTCVDFDGEKVCISKTTKSSTVTKPAPDDGGCSVGSTRRAGHSPALLALAIAILGGARRRRR